MTPFQCFCEYVALKNHFNTKSYDYIKYNGRTNATEQMFENRNDKGFFYRLAKEKQPFRLLLANFVYNDKCWIGDLAFNLQSEENYKKWNKIQKNMEYYYSQDLHNLNNDFDSNFRTKGEIPFVIELYQYGKINIETVVVLNNMISCIPIWDKKIKDPLYQKISFKIKKYTPFVMYNKQKIKSITKNHFGGV